MSDDTKIWPHHELGSRLSNWGRWGDDDELGTLNFVTAEKRIRAAQLVKTGKIFDVGMAFDENGPQDGHFRTNPIHVMTLAPSDVGPSPDGMIGTDDMVILPTQSATQWDGLAHIGYNGYFYNGVPASAVSTWHGVSRNSAASTVERLISRGVLLDIARLNGVEILPDSYEVTSEDLTAATERQGVQIESGDFILLRTGSYQYFTSGDIGKFRGSKEAGLGWASAEWFYDHEIAAVAVDNWACEVRPSTIEGSSSNPFHQVAIRDMGLTIGEIFNFEELAVDCEADGVWEFLFSAVGLKITNAVALPLTPMAIK
jgi:kynurenine formamidase